MLRVWKIWQSLHPGQFLLGWSSKQFRHELDRLLTALELQSFRFRPYSLRRGGATAEFKRTSNVEALMVRGRWQSLKTAKIYLQEGLSELARMHLSEQHIRFLSVLAKDCLQ